MVPIDSVHPMYKDIINRSQIVRDVLSGRVKNKRYIPDVDYRNQRRCTRHRNRAVLVNFTKRTLQNFLGLIFKTAPVIDVPPLLEYIKLDTTGNKLTLEQLARECIKEVFTAGAVAVFVDYPLVKETVDQVTQDELQLKARMNLYLRESYGNWFTVSDSGSDEITLVVLKEAKNEIDAADGYAWKTSTQYRVLKINEEGYFEVSVLNDKGAQQGKSDLPKAMGKYLTTIPFFVAGAEINDINAENLPPLQDLAELNLAHLRNSADFEEAAFLVGQASLFFTSNINATVMENKLKAKPITLGSDTGHFLGESGSAFLVQANETSMHTKGMADKMQHAIMTGASILMPAGGQVKSAKTTKMDKSSEVSVMETVISNVEEMLTLAAKAQAIFMGADPNMVEIKLNHELIDESADPAVMREIASGIVQGFWPRSTAQNYARETNILELSNEELDELVAQENPIDPNAEYY